MFLKANLNHENHVTYFDSNILRDSLLIILFNLILFFYAFGENRFLESTVKGKQQIRVLVGLFC